jgi:hypothetical protein
VNPKDHEIVWYQMSAVGGHSLLGEELVGIVAGNVIGGRNLAVRDALLVVTLR